MKTSAIVCAVLAGSFGFGSVAQAQSWRDRDHRQDHNQRWEQHDGRGDRHRDHRGDHRWDGGRDHRGPSVHWQQPHYSYQQPRYVYQQPRYGAIHRYHRGGYLPYQYRNNGYYVSNWQAYPGLYAPPYGYQWASVDGDFLLVALATGLIANALVSSY